jgi:hypothetical protein
MESMTPRDRVPGENAPPDPSEAWQHHMRRGAWEEAWRISDRQLAARRKSPRGWSVPRHLQPIWDGTALAGRHVLVRCYHGLGDTLQFIRLVPCLTAIAASVTVWAQPVLIPLLRGTPGIGDLLPLHDGTPEVAFDAEVEIMELPHVFRITPEALASMPVPYLRPACPPTPPRAVPAGLAVGLVWQAGGWDPRRSVPPALLRPLATIPGVTPHLLQRGPALAEVLPDFGIADGSDDVLQAACRMAALDLVLTVDSMPAHLAGALGLPVWTMLHADADWRWMRDRADSPWYPTMHLFRQARPGDWDSVVAAVEVALRALCAVRGL